MFLSNNLSLVLTPLAQEAKYLRVLSQSETHTDYIGIRFGIAASLLNLPLKSNLSSL